MNNCYQRRESLRPTYISGSSASLAITDHTSPNTCAEQLGKAKLYLLSQPAATIVPTPETCNAAAEAVCCDALLVTTASELLLAANLVGDSDLGTQARRDVLQTMSNGCKEYSGDFQTALRSCPTAVNLIIQSAHADGTLRRSEAAE
eukprot:Platyproteum_vivax@DN17097_c0_g1_i1.p1